MSATGRPQRPRLQAGRFGDDPWALRETAPPDDAAWAETLFAVGNGHLGVRATPDEGGGAEPGTFLNAFCETFPIAYPEDAYGYARLGQTMVAVPDASVLRLEAGGAAFDLAGPGVESYSRVLDFRQGALRREVVWASPAGRVRIVTERLASFAQPACLLFTLEATPLDGPATLAVTSEVALARPRLRADGLDPRRADRPDGPVLLVEHIEAEGHRGRLAAATCHSGQPVVVTVDHLVSPEAEAAVKLGDRMISWRYAAPAGPGRPLRAEKRVTVTRPGEAAPDVDWERLKGGQAAWLEDYWERADIALGGADPADQQAVRWTLFQLAQATAAAGADGAGAKGVTGSGYSGHRFWDTELFVLPQLTYTDPGRARDLLGFRRRTLPAARARAAELGHQGALFAWRTITGEEASAYFPAGTAQYHIGAAVSYAVAQYAAATGDRAYLAAEGRSLLVATARFWASLGCWGQDGAFHLNGVTGPDEYSALADDNLYTNAMARANLRAAAAAAEAFPDPADPVTPAEIAAWRHAADRLAIPRGPGGLLAQDARFLSLEPWDFAATAADQYPLLLHFHPLNLYRRQVLKQADTVVALWLLGDEFTPGDKARAFRYYDPLTTGDSTLSAVAQQVVAAELGEAGLAWEYFQEGLAVDLANAHANTGDGLHLASAGGVWGMLVAGFGGFRDHGGFRLDPRLPAQWDSLTFRLTLRGWRIAVEIRPGEVRLTPEVPGPGPVPGLAVWGRPVTLEPGVTAHVTERA